MEVESFCIFLFVLDQVYILRALCTTCALTCALPCPRTSTRAVRCQIFKKPCLRILGANYMNMALLTIVMFANYMTLKTDDYVKVRSYTLIRALGSRARASTPAPHLRICAFTRPLLHVHF